MGQNHYEADKIPQNPFEHLHQTLMDSGAVAIPRGFPTLYRLEDENNPERTFSLRGTYGSTQLTIALTDTIHPIWEPTGVPIELIGLRDGISPQTSQMETGLILWAITPESSPHAAQLVEYQKDGTRRDPTAYFSTPFTNMDRMLLSQIGVPLLSQLPAAIDFAATVAALAEKIRTHNFTFSLPNPHPLGK